MRQDKYTIHWICEQPTPSNDYLFSVLASDLEIDLKVHFMATSLSSHPWKSSAVRAFNSRSYSRILGLDWHLIRLSLRAKSQIFVIGGWAEPTVIMIIAILSLLGKRYAIWTDTPRLNQHRHILKSILRSLWLKWVFQKAAFILGTGEPAKEALSAMGCPIVKIINFPFFVDLNAFTPNAYSNWDFKNHEVVLLSSGRLINSIKAHDLAINALSILRQKTGIASYKYKIAGVGPDEKVLRELVDKLGLQDKIEFMGWVEADELPSFYKQGHVLLHPSHIDNYPATVLEAMATGLPVIGSDNTGAIIDRICHGCNGLIHKTGDVEDLAKQIEQLLTAPENIVLMAEQARKTAEKWPAEKAILIVKEAIRNTN